MDQDSHSPAPRWRAAVVTILALAFVARLTLVSGPVDPDETHAGFFCLARCNNEGSRDFLSNILLFIPLGWALSHWLARRPAVLTCIAATIAIETLQATVLVGRDSSSRDILANSLGGGLGVWLYHDWRHLFWPGRGTGLRLAAAALVAWFGVLTLSGFGTHLAPSSNPYYGITARAYGHYAQYDGQVLGLQVNGSVPPDGFWPDPSDLRAAMRRDSVLVTVQAVTGPAPRRTAPIYSVVDSAHDEQILVGQNRNALVLQLRTRFEQWEFRALSVRLPLFEGRNPGDTVRIEAGQRGTAWVIAASSGRRHSEMQLPLTVGWGWASMLPFRYALWDEWLLLNPVWLAGLVFPVGYWFTRSSPGVGIGCTALALGAGLAAIPRIAAAAPTTTPEWLGALLGAILGCAAGLWSRRLVPLSRSAA